MKVLSTLATILLLIAAPGCGGGAPAVPGASADAAGGPRTGPPPAVPEQAKTWTWNPDDADLAKSVASALPDCETRREGDRGGELVVVSRTGRVLRIPVHDKTPLVRSGDVLVAADYHRYSTGCTLSAWSLASGERLWTAPLAGLGEIGHSKYANLVTLEIVDGLAVARSEESAGRYVEAVDLANGARAWHEVLPR